MANGNRETYTDLLLREICAHLHWLANTSAREAGHRDAFYEAARSIGRNRKEFVSRTLRQMDWHKAIANASGKEGGNVG